MHEEGRARIGEGGGEGRSARGEEVIEGDG